MVAGIKAIVHKAGPPDIGGTQLCVRCGKTLKNGANWLSSSGQISPGVWWAIEVGSDLKDGGRYGVFSERLEKDEVFCTRID